MKIKLLIATEDFDYAEHLSGLISEKNADNFEVTTCFSAEELENFLSNRFDVALIDGEICDSISSIRKWVSLPLVLEDGRTSDIFPNEKHIKKYQRISSIVAQILEAYSILTPQGRNISGNSRMTAVWSPSGGSGKTTFAIALAAKICSTGKKALYLDLEPFSSVDMYFESVNKGLSSVLEMLDKNVNLEMLLQSVRQEDSGSGICYYGKPDNYDDLNVLTEDDLSKLLNACGSGVDEVVIDLPSVCDNRIRSILEQADRIAAVIDPSKASGIKWKQFISQNDLYDVIRGKLTLVANRGAGTDPSMAEKVISLPAVQSLDPIAVYKTLSVNGFDFNF